MSAPIKQNLAAVRQREFEARAEEAQRPSGDAPPLTDKEALDGLAFISSVQDATDKLAVMADDENLKAYRRPNPEDKKKTTKKKGTQALEKARQRLELVQGVIEGRRLTQSFGEDKAVNLAVAQLRGQLVRKLKDHQKQVREMKEAEAGYQKALLVEARAKEMASAALGVFLVDHFKTQTRQNSA